MFCGPLLADAALPHGCEWVLLIVHGFRVLKYMQVYRIESSKFPEDDVGEGRRKGSIHKDTQLPIRF